MIEPPACARGAYRAAVTQPGVYRAKFRGAYGAPVRVR